MAEIVITSVPPGAAPKVIRAAWIGLNLTVAGDAEAKPYKVLSIDAHFDDSAQKMSPSPGIDNPKTEEMIGYAVEFMPAIWVLEQAGKTQEALWWCQNMPHLLRPGQVVIFPTSCCVLASQ